MTVTDIHTETAAAPLRKSTFRRLLRDPMGAIPLAILALIVLSAVFAGLLAPHSHTVAQLRMMNAPPGEVYLLGGDGGGRDILSRLLFAGRLTLIGALITTVISAAIGITFGLLAGYRGRRFDSIASWISDVVQVLPGIIVLVALFTIIGPSAMMTMVVLGVMISPSFFRLTRSLTLDIRNELYVSAARVSGLGDARILSRHILSVIKAPLVLHCAHIAGVAIIMQAGLEFIGLGDPGTPTWGGMLQDAFNNIYRSPTAFLWPGIAIGLTVACLLLVSNALRDVWYRREPIPAEETAKAETFAKPVIHDAPAQTDPLLAIDDLRVAYGDTQVVHGVSITVQKGQIVGLVGESGSGKTQTSLAVLGLLPRGGQIAGGRILFEGQDLAKATPSQLQTLRGRKIGYIPQEPMSNLDPTFRIGQQLCEPLQVKLGLSKRQARDKALDLLASVEIKDPLRVFNAYPHEISGGMAQRVLIAGAVSCDPDLLIADEPTTALDATVQAEILDIMRQQQAQRGMGILMVTHNFGVVADLCDEVVVMRMGRIVEQGPAAAVFGSPRAPYTQRLLSLTLEDCLPRNARQKGDRLMGAVQ